MVGESLMAEQLLCLRTVGKRDPVSPGTNKPVQTESSGGLKDDEGL